VNRRRAAFPKRHRAERGSDSQHCQRRAQAVARERSDGHTKENQHGHYGAISAGDSWRREIRHFTGQLLVTD
jgi:hypothetical protein